MDTISKAYAKEIAALKLKKYRQKHQKFIVEGPNMVTEAQKQNKYSIECIVGTEAYFEKEVTIASSFPRFLASGKLMGRMSTLKTHYECLAVLNMEEEPDFDFEKGAIYLDGIQDPGNLGTIMRSAEWFGIQQLITSEDTVDPFNNKSIQASAGSIYRVHCYSGGEEILKEASQRSISVYGLAMEGTSVFEYPIESNSITIIGSEGNGIRDDLNELIDVPLHIPQSTTNQAESLNAGISAAIFLSQWYKEKNR